MLLYALPLIPYEYTDAFFGNSTEILNIMYPTKIHVVKATVFPIVKYGCESWTIKKAEHWIIDALELGTGEGSWESIGKQRDQTSQS